MSKNVALNLSELVVSIVFATVVPDWECKSAGFIFNMQALTQSIFEVFFDFLPKTLKVNFITHEKILTFFYAFSKHLGQYGLRYQKAHLASARHAFCLMN
jgi:hypothetical protein